MCSCGEVFVFEYLYGKCVATSPQVEFPPSQLSRERARTRCLFADEGSGHHDDQDDNGDGNDDDDYKDGKALNIMMIKIRIIMVMTMMIKTKSIIHLKVCRLWHDFQRLFRNGAWSSTLASILVARAPVCVCWH